MYEQKRVWDAYASNFIAWKGTQAKVHVCINVYKTDSCGYLPHFILYIPSHAHYVCNPIVMKMQNLLLLLWFPVASVCEGMYKMKYVK